MHGITPRSINFIILLVWMLGGLILLYMAVEASEYYLIAVVFFMVTVAAALWRLVRCPKCGKSLHRSQYIMRGIYSPFLPKDCSSCGEKID